MSLIEEFRESEKQRLNWLQKLSANYPDVTATRLLAGEYATPEIKTVITIKPSFFRKSMYFLAFGVTLFSFQGIFTAWDQIVETAIMRQPQPRGVARFLVIFKRNGSVGKSDLFLFNVSDRKLASAVEYNKAQALR
jgi:hypothetical protein